MSTLDYSHTTTPNPTKSESFIMINRKRRKECCKCKKNLGLIFQLLYLIHVSHKQRWDNDEPTESEVEGNHTEEKKNQTASFKPNTVPKKKNNTTVSPLTSKHEVRVALVYFASCPSFPYL